jgi:hypothetical protein
MNLESQPTVGIERRQGERRNGDRRRPSGAAVDVTRIEHENLYGQVEQILRTLARVEGKLQGLTDRMDRLEADFDLMLERKRA